VSVLGARKVGDSLEVEIERQGRRGTMKVGLGLRPF
jgi:hypothetical protein